MTYRARPLHVGYVLKRFPKLSETFILNEILELERQGVKVTIFSLLKPPAEPRHALLDRVKAKVVYLRATPLAVRTGPDARQKCLIADELLAAGPPEAALFFGKSAEEIVALHAKATTIAMLAPAYGIRHLHAHFGTDATTVALLAVRLAQLPFSFTAHARDIWHTYVNHQADDAMRREKIAEAAFVITVSDYNRRHLLTLGGPAAAHKLHRLYNGIDLRRFDVAKDEAVPPLVLSVGRLIEKKGFPDLITACRLLFERRVEFHCLIVGNGPDRGMLEGKIAEAGLGERIELAGALPQEKVIDLMARAAVMVLPCVVSESGDRDGLPTVLLEALAARLPVVTTDVSGNPEIIDDEEIGFLVPERRPDRLADALSRVLANANLRASMGAKGRSKAERDFDLRTNVAELRHHFEASAQPYSVMEAAE